MDIHYDAHERRLESLQETLARMQTADAARAQKLLREALTMLKEGIEEFRRLKEERLEMQQRFANEVAGRESPLPES